jgi:GNAT superfamily N-acetyltransferase
MTVTIRRAEPRDAAVVAEYNRRLALETEAKVLDPAVLARGVARILADSTRGLYYVAEANGEVVGQVMLTYEWSDWRDGWLWWYQSVYVREDARRLGVFRQLFDTVVRAARDAGDVVGLRLYVEKDNLRAQQTYQKMGMSDGGYLFYHLPFIDLK